MSKPNEALVYNRTLADVNLRNTKGTLSYEQLNRVENWCLYLEELLNKYGYYIKITVKTDWTMQDIPTLSDIDRIRSNILELKNTYYVLSSTPVDKVSVNKTSLNYVEANAFEKILNDIEYLINSMQTRFVHSGVANAGQDKTYQNRFRTKRTWSAIPFNAISNALDWYEVKNIATQSDSIDDTYSESSSVYGNILYYNESLNKLDKIIGGDN